MELLDDIQNHELILNSMKDDLYVTQQELDDTCNVLRQKQQQILTLNDDLSGKNKIIA